mgnify:CR=1 FL=1
MIRERKDEIEGEKENKKNEKKEQENEEGTGGEEKLTRADAVRSG